MKLHLLRGRGKDLPKVDLGTLEYTGTEYIWTYSNAKEEYDLYEGFFEVPGLPLHQKEHKSEFLFGFFAGRIPPRRRGDFKDHLSELGLDKYNEWDYVKISGLRLLTDSYELVEVI